MLPSHHYDTTHHTNAPVLKSNRFLRRIISNRYWDEHPFLVKQLATWRLVSIHLNSCMFFWCKSSLRMLMSICSLLLSTAVDEWALSTSDLLSHSTDMGNRGHPSILDSNELRAMLASDASTAARHSTANVLFTTLFTLWLCHDNKV